MIIIIIIIMMVIIIIIPMIHPTYSGFVPNGLTNLFTINVEVIVGCNCGSDLWTFRSTEVVTRRTERMQEKI